MKVYTELKVWIDYNPESMLYYLGYCGSDQIIMSIYLVDANTIPKIVWDMLHKDQRQI